jgi:signal transduction histidine kinase
MVDYREGIKRKVAEVKFLIHDLRVEQFINDVIHFHVTLDTDLEIYSADAAQVLHGQDVQVLKAKAVDLRKALRDYSNSVTNFSPDQTILLTGQKYIDTIHSTCELILDPLWGRIDRVLSFLPSESLSAQSRSHYRNCLQWIGGVRRRIEYFLDEQRQEPTPQEFDIGAEIRDFTSNVIRGYVTEKGRAKVELQLGRLDSAVIRGSLPRFRRMYFNLVMNAVDAMRGRKVGILNISDVIEGDQVVLRVLDNGSGMTPQKKQELLTDKETLDGELRSLGFVFVRQTISEHGAKLSIESELGKATTIAVSFPFLVGRTMTSTPLPSQDEYGLLSAGDRSRRRGEAVVSGPDTETTTQTVAPSGSTVAAPEAIEAAPTPPGDELVRYGWNVYEDYEVSEADFPGGVFFLGVTEDDRVDFFSHKPYERGWNITHEDLSPMLFQSAVRGRVEEDDARGPVVILKPPMDPGEYFDSREVPRADRSPAAFVEMVHDEYIRVARKLIATGLSGEMGLHLADVRRFFPGQDELLDLEPFPLKFLAEQAPIRRK